MRHPRLIKWEGKLKKILDELDVLLEDEYGAQYQLHPARAKRGQTSNKARDGLFDITAGFSAGYGSEYGRGYIVNIHLSTLENVPEKIKHEIEMIVLEKLKKKLPQHFPGKNLQVNKDNNVIKIHGDLSLGIL